MADIDFGQIPFNLICRFGELSKNEIITVSCLYAHRNQETSICNPSRKLISQETNIEKGNLSRAIAGLEEKGWVVEQENGHFILLESCQINNKKVVDSTTKKNKKLLNLQPKVVESTTESCQIYNSHIKELNRERTEKEQLADLSYNSVSEERSATNTDIPPSPLPNIENKSVVAVPKTDAESVFNHWVEVCVVNKTSAVFNKKRKAAVLAILKEYSVEDVRDAINGCNITPHNNGLNTTNTIYKDLELICRNGVNLERFRDNWSNRNAPKIDNRANSSFAVYRNGGFLPKTPPAYKFLCDNGK